MPVADGMLTPTMLTIWDWWDRCRRPRENSWVGRLWPHTSSIVSRKIWTYSSTLPSTPGSCWRACNNLDRRHRSTRSEGTLNCVFGGVKIQFLSVVGQHRIERGRKVGEMVVGSFPDVVATKLKVVGDQGELRDYYDLMCIEVMGDTDTMGMLDWYCLRYGVDSTHQSIYHLVRALGSVSDVADDPWLAASL